MGTNKETVVYERGLHPGVFALPSLFGLFLLLFGGLLRMVFGVVSKSLNPGGTIPAFNWLFLFYFGPLALLGLFAFLVTSLAYRTNMVKLTTERLTIKTGFLSKTEATLNNTEIESVFFRQPLLGQWLGYGTVVVVGTGGTPFEMRFMPEPKDLQEKVLYVKNLVKGSPKQIVRPEPPIQDDSRYMPKGR